jgi:glutamate-1-semialdehyde 2,1-aminomutase
LLFERAKKLIPGGIHLSGRPLTEPASSPMYFDRAFGCRVTDVDGNDYVDYLMAFGPYLLGYANEEVDAAAMEQGKRGRLLSLNHPFHLTFMEQVLDRFRGAEMGCFFRTGSEATTAALRIARRATGRTKVARCGYHGWHDWCLPLEDYVPRGLEQEIMEFDANTPTSLVALFDAHPGQIAAVIVAPEMVCPHVPDTFHELRRLTHGHGAVFVMDEVKTGLRIAPGTVAARIGLVPDILTLSKALGNGWPVAVAIGQKSVMEAGAGIHYSATFHGDTAAMAAALKTIELVDAEGAAEHAERVGTQLLTGLQEIGVRHGLPCEAFAEPFPAMPFFRFTDTDPNVKARLTSAFFGKLLELGVLFHPRHMWFMSLAHDAATVDRTLACADEAMTDVARNHAAS